MDRDFLVKKIKRKLRRANLDKLIVAKWEELHGTPFVGNVNDPDDIMTLIDDIKNHEDYEPDIQ